MHSWYLFHWYWLSFHSLVTFISFSHEIYFILSWYLSHSFVWVQLHSFTAVPSFHSRHLFHSFIQMQFHSFMVSISFVLTFISFSCDLYFILSRNLFHSFMAPNSFFHDFYFIHSRHLHHVCFILLGYYFIQYFILPGMYFNSVRVYCIFPNMESLAILNEK